MPATFQTRAQVQDRPDASPRYGAVRTGSFRRILVPVDFSTATNAALESARALASRSGGTIWLLHVIEADPMMGGMDAVVLVKPDGAIVAEVQANLDRFATQMARLGVVARVLVRHGKAPNTICRVAGKMGADLIVMSRHRHAWWERLLSESTAEKILRHAPCPVLALPGVGTADDALYALQDGAFGEDGEPVPSCERTHNDETQVPPGACSSATPRDPCASPQQRQR